MSKEEFKHLIEYGYELEFTWNKKRFSISYCDSDTKKNYISFCEFYKDSTEVSTFEELCNVKRYNTTVLEMILSIDDNNISIF